MVSAIDRSDVLILTKDDFNRAMTWMTDAELTMPEYSRLEQGTRWQAMEEIYHFVLVNGVSGPVPERKIIRFATDLVPLHSIERW